MRIDPTVITPITDAQARPTAGRTKRNTQPASVVSLGTDAETAASAVGPEISARVSRVRELLAKGEYVVDLDKLASRILDDDLAREGQK